MSGVLDFTDSGYMCSAKGTLNIPSAAGASLTQATQASPHHYTDEARAELAMYLAVNWIVGQPENKSSTAEYPESYFTKGTGNVSQGVLKGRAWEAMQDYGIREVRYSACFIVLGYPSSIKPFKQSLLDNFWTII